MIGKKINAVDDDEDIPETVILILQSKGFKAVPLSTPQHLLQKIQEHNPHVFVLDEQMENTTGDNFANALKSEAESANCLKGNLARHPVPKVRDPQQCLS